jgi:hypothetical protein
MSVLKPGVEFNLSRQSTFLEFARDPEFLEVSLAAMETKIEDIHILPWQKFLEI